MTHKATETFKARSDFYKLVEELNGLSAQTWKRTHSKEIRDRFKKAIRILSEIEKHIPPDNNPK